MTRRLALAALYCRGKRRLLSKTSAAGSIPRPKFHWLLGKKSPPFRSGTIVFGPVSTFSMHLMASLLCLVLTDTIQVGAAKTACLRLSLINNAVRPVTVVTGITTGGTPHPAARFRFALKFRDKHRVELWCANSTTCGPGIIAGTLQPYTVTLAPNQIFRVEIPLADFYAIDGKGERLCTRETEGGRLIATLIGSDSGAQDGYWTGKVSESILLTCQGVFVRSHPRLAPQPRTPEAPSSASSEQYPR